MIKRPMRFQVSSIGAISYFWLMSFLFLLLVNTPLCSQTTKFIFQRPKMGSPFIISVFADDSMKVLPIIEKAFHRVDTLNQIFSDYIETSEISKLDKKTKDWQIVSPDLYLILKISERAYKDSEGAYDVTVSPIVKIWRKARKSKSMPDKEILNAALTKVGFKNIDIDKNLPRIKFKIEGVQLDFGGIVKGFAAQEVVNILSKNGYPNCLVDAGGDLAMGTKSNGWKIAINLPNENTKTLPHFLSLQNQSVATSGDMYKYLEYNGKRYSHIVNPKTGLGLTHQRNITVITPDGALADWLATACSVLPIRKAMRLIKKYKNTELLILENKNGKIKSWQSPNFEKYFELNKA